MRISVALCSFNGESFIREQLESITNQSRPPDEVVISDDASTDRTRSIVRSFADSSAFPVLLLTNEHRLGSTKNFDKAIAHCSGDIIVLSDQDDVWRQDKLGVIEKEFEADAEAGLLFTDANLVDEEMQPTGTRLWDYTFRPELRSAWNKDPFATILRHNIVTGATAAFLARFRPLIQPIPDDLSCIHDGWISSLIAAVAKVRPLPESLVDYRQHASQQLGISTNDVPSTSYSRANYYEAELRKLDRLEDRLRSCPEGLEGADLATSLETLSELREHYHIRFSHMSRFERARQVLRELFTRRYHRFSKGFPSALSDVIRG
jgi:glycosyltransferase involved in cell wall biosynthesis